MQALIDFDGWRKWKDFSQQGGADAEKDGAAKSAKLSAANKKKKANRSSLGSNPSGSTSRLAIREESAESVAVS